MDVSLSPCLECGTPCQGIRCGDPRCGPATRADRTRVTGRDTADWRKVTRPMVLNRDGHRCRLMLPGCTTTATSVHRLPERGPYHDSDLSAYVSACAKCHGKVDGARATY